MTPTFRYSQTRSWLKGNTHVHSTRSDGAMPPEQVCDLYARAGYDFIALTDHRVAGDEWGRKKGPLLVLNGLELDGLDPNGAYHHVVVLGELTGIQHELAGQGAAKGPLPLRLFMQRIDPERTFSIWAHPHWSLNTFEDGLLFDFDAIEVFNSCSQMEIGRGYGLAHWDYLLPQRPNLLGIAADDAHHKDALPCWGGGWIMVNAQSANPEAVLQALKGGDFYATSGPAFYAFEYTGTSVRVETSPVRVIRLITPGLHGDFRVAASQDSPLNRAAFDLPDSWQPIRLELEDFQGRTAWSNPLFVLPNPAVSRFQI